MLLQYVIYMHQNVISDGEKQNKSSYTPYGYVELIYLSAPWLQWRISQTAAGVMLIGKHTP